MIRDNSPNVNAFGNTGPQLNSNVTIDVYALNGKRAISSYSQLSWIVHFLQNLLAHDVIVLASFSISTSQVLIYMVFARACYCLPISD